MIIAKFLALTLSIAILFFGLHLAMVFSFFFKSRKELFQQDVLKKGFRYNFPPVFVYVLLATPFAAVALLFFE
jgi:hypothetical protein